MLKNTLMFVLLFIVSLFSLTFALIMLYSSPDETVHTLEASLFILAGSLASSSIMYSIDLSIEKGYIMKAIYAIYTILFTASYAAVGLICKYASPSNTADTTAMGISFLAATIVLIGAIFAIKQTKRVSYE